jgi:membrane-anchored mycosin MYCP
MRRALAAGAAGMLATATLVAAASGAGAATGAQQCDPAHEQWVTRPPAALGTLSADAAWRTATGAGVTVAVVDSGVDARNAHLGDAVVLGVDLVAGTDGRTDEDGHGTAVAGIIAARPLEQSAVEGLAPAATILPVRVFTKDDAGAQDAGTAPTPARIAAGINAAVDAGARVVNVSLSTPDDDPALRAAVDHATAAGALVVASTGNRTGQDQPADQVRYPAAYPGVLAVVAVDANGNLSDGSFAGPHVDVAAPGTDVATSYFAAGDCVLADAAASSSYAAAYVSGAAALVAQRHPDEPPSQWAYRLEVTAARVTPGARTDAAGWGVIRPDAALAFVDDGSAQGPDSPTHARPAAAPAADQVLEPASSPDPLHAVRASAAWWMLAGLVIVTLAALAVRLTGGRREAA